MVSNTVLFSDKTKVIEETKQQNKEEFSRDESTVNANIINKFIE